MADPNFDDVEDGYGYGPADHHAPLAISPLQRIISLAGALTTVAVIIGVGVWGYKIAVRDANGIPVVRALEGPMRVAPRNPGGSVADHQGLAINTIAAVGAAAPLPEQIMLAPAPVALAEEDAPGLAPPVVVVEPAPAEAIVAAAPAPSLAPADTDPVADALVTAMAGEPGLSVTDPMAEVAEAGRAATDVLSLADMLANGAAPLSDLAPGGPEDLVQASAAAVVPGGVARSLRPLSRPAGIQRAAASPANDPLSAAVADAVAGALAGVVTEVDPETLKKGDRLVQLGAFDDVESARAEWDKLAGRFTELMTGKGRVIQSAQSGGRTFYRLRAHGFDDEADARRFCSALLAEEAACIPVAIR
ncbi:SPOR domain-containing protein [Aliigemmobacter aestuarii]|uniref:SPOR domain-containing protein n=1 Tax=Aliigemmobacter aestuarii TaxID=1445661 RepID=A0A4S3MPQ6_9RHOB|nr:SPOR domain-containing protein [Gemmobacter aestuarii]THD83149.1 SPOR domain-containing protein [Gemmobacter aestuarii]